MKRDNSHLYEAATQSLLKKLDEMNLPLAERLRAKNLTLLFRYSFKLETVKHDTFYPYVDYDYQYFPYDSYGFCRASSFSFVSLMNSKNWRLMYINEVWKYGPHFYVMHMPTKTPFDLTFDQYAYDDINIPYFMGRPSQIDGDGRNVIMRFLNAAGLDFSTALKNVNKGL